MVMSHYNVETVIKGTFELDGAVEFFGFFLFGLQKKNRTELKESGRV